MSNHPNGRAFKAGQWVRVFGTGVFQVASDVVFDDTIKVFGNVTLMKDDQIAGVIPSNDPRLELLNLIEAEIICLHPSENRVE